MGKSVKELMGDRELEPQELVKNICRFHSKLINIEYEVSLLSDAATSMQSSLRAAWCRACVVCYLPSVVQLAVLRLIEFVASGTAPLIITPTPLLFLALAALLRLRCMDLGCRHPSFNTL